MFSLRKLRANRRNAQNSTGPKTDQGKARSSRNALRHGVFCRAVLLPGDNEHLFAALHQDLIDSLRPRGLFQLALVERIAGAQWRLSRLDEAEHFEYTNSTRSPARLTRANMAVTPGAQCWDLLTEKDRVLEHIELLRTRLERSISRALRELQQLQDRASGGQTPAESPHSDTSPEAFAALADELGIEAPPEQADEADEADEEADEPHLESEGPEPALPDAPPSVIVAENAQNEPTDSASPATHDATAPYNQDESDASLAWAYARATKRDTDVQSAADTPRQDPCGLIEARRQ